MLIVSERKSMHRVYPADKLLRGHNGVAKDTLDATRKLANEAKSFCQFYFNNTLSSRKALSSFSLIMRAKVCHISPRTLANDNSGRRRDRDVFPRREERWEQRRSNQSFKWDNAVPYMLPFWMMHVPNVRPLPNQFIFFAIRAHRPSILAIMTIPTIHILSTHWEWCFWCNFIGGRKTGVYDTVWTSSMFTSLPSWST